MPNRYVHYRRMLVEIVKENPGASTMEIHDLLQNMRGSTGNRYRNVPTRRAVYVLLRNTPCFEPEGIFT